MEAESENIKISVPEGKDFNQEDLMFLRGKIEIGNQLMSYRKERNIIRQFLVDNEVRFEIVQQIEEPNNASPALFNRNYTINSFLKYLDVIGAEIKIIKKKKRPNPVKK